MITGIEVGTVAKIISPVMAELLKGAKGKLEQSFSKWKVNGFASRLAKKLVDADKIRTIWSPEKEASLLSIYYPSKIRVNGERTVNSLVDLPDGNLIVQGIVGHGKSIFLRYLYLQELAGNGGGKLPIFIELRTLSEKRNLQSHIEEALEKLGLQATFDVFDYLAESGKVVLLLDGFDEIDEALVKEAIVQIEYLIERYLDLKVIVTSRPSAEIQKSRLLSIVEIVGLRRSDYPHFLKKLGLSTKKTNELVEAIKQSPSDISRLITTPLMLTLLVLVYEAEKNIPTELQEFYEKLFVTMFSRHDRLKAGFEREHFSGLSERRLQQLFEIFCFIAIQNGHGRTLDAMQFANTFDSAIKYFGQGTCELENFRKDIVKVSCLMLEEGFDQTTFIHKSVAEYFAASFLWRSSDKIAKRFYENVLGDGEAWGTVLMFLEKIDQYRYVNYFAKPALDNLLKELKAGKNVVVEDVDWVNFFVKNNPSFRISYSRRVGVLGDFDLVEYGPYSPNVPWGRILQDQVISALVSGLQKVIPPSMSETELADPTSMFQRQELPNSTIEYSKSLIKIVEENGTEVLLESCRTLEVKLWRSIQDYDKVIQSEDAKQELVSGIDILAP